VSNEVVLKATKRDVLGKKLNALRAEGNAPAVVHDHGKDSIHITLPHSELKRAYYAAGKHAPVKLKIEDKQYTALIKDVVYKPATQIILHTVFQAVSANETVSAEVPLKLSDEIPAVRASLLVVSGIDHVEVEALPKDLVDSIEVDASVLVEAGDKITVADLKAPEGVTIKTDPEQLVASVETPRDQVAEADAAAAELAADAGVPETDGEAESEASDETAAKTEEE
jgi:large subunit ribosomal protein L25